MLLREAIPTAVAVGVLAVVDALTMLDVPIVASATLLAVIVLGVRIGRLQTMVENNGVMIAAHGRILEDHGRMLAEHRKAIKG